MGVYIMEGVGGLRTERGTRPYGGSNPLHAGRSQESKGDGLHVEAKFKTVVSVWLSKDRTQEIFNIDMEDFRLVGFVVVVRDAKKTNDFDPEMRDWC